MKIALIQQHATADKSTNLARGLAAAQRAADDGAQIVVFPELAFDLFYPQVPATAASLAHAEPISGRTTTAFCDLAAAHEIVVVLNIFERDERTGLTYDSSPVIDADGTLLGTTRMVHITEYEHFHEQGYYAPGDHGAPVYDTRYGRLGVAICYDRHYPEYMRALAVKGADLVVIPQAGAVGEWPAGLYEAEMRTMAFQNGYFIGLCNRVGREEDLVFAGESFVCSPDGEVVARAGTGTDEILQAEIDLGQTALSNARRLFLRDRRPELYPDWITD